MSKRLKLKDFLSKFPVISKISVKWGELDAYQHVNNTVYLKYQEVARLRYFSYLLKEVDPEKFDIEKFSNGTGIGPIMSDTYCAFKFPLTVPDKVLVGSTILKGDLHDDRYKLTHSIWSLRHQRVVADGYGTVVSYDFSKMKSCKMPAQLVHAIEKVQLRDSLHLHDPIQSITDLEDEF
jgi:acyl-CoA thioester hydrolase